MSELAARLGVTSSTATGLVDRLVELGLLARHDDPADRRQVVVSATPEAQANLEHFRELNSRRMRELLERLAPATTSPSSSAPCTVLAAAIEPGSAVHPPSTTATTDEGNHA